MCGVIMTSKEKLNKIYLRVQNNLDIVGDDIVDFIFDIKRDLEVLEMFKRLLKNKSNWVKTDFGTTENKLCIDGCIEYIDNEKEILLEWLNE